MKKICNFNLENIDAYLKYAKLSDGLSTISRNLKPEECLEFVNNSVELSTKIQHEFGLENTNALLPESIWIAQYLKHSSNEIHNHTSSMWQEKCNYIGILILNTGINEEIIIFDETNSTANFYKLKNGDCFLVANEILHGLSQVNDSVTAIMFPVQTAIV
jgi:hypothetical protein